MSTAHLIQEMKDLDKMEKTPDGLGQHEPGAKLDAGKLDLSLFFESFPNAIEAVTRVGMFGAAKYTRGGFKSVENGVVRYANAGYRHALEEMRGELTDKDSGLSHKAHKAWNAMAELELSLLEEVKPSTFITPKPPTPHKDTKTRVTFVVTDEDIIEAESIVIQFLNHKLAPARFMLKVCQGLNNLSLPALPSAGTIVIDLDTLMTVEQTVDTILKEIRSL